MRERERIAATVADMRARADQLDAAASGTSEGMVPERGQPILVGHHSEAAHRRMMARAGRTWDRQADQARRAEALRRQAAGIEAKSAREVYDDDPDAIDRLEAAIVGHELEIQGIKASAIRALDEGLRREAVASIRRKIRTTRKRIERLAAAVPGDGSGT